MGSLRIIVMAGCVLAGLSSLAQTVRFRGSVRAGEVYRHLIGHGLVLTVTTAGIEVHPAGAREHDDEFARCVTPPDHGPNALDFEAWQFDPARREVSPGITREFHFVMNAADNLAECEELRRVVDPRTAESSRFQSHPMGAGVVRLSGVRVEGNAVLSLRFRVLVTVPLSGR